MRGLFISHRSIHLPLFPRATLLHHAEKAFCTHALLSRYMPEKKGCMSSL